MRMPWCSSLFPPCLTFRFTWRRKHTLAGALIRNLKVTSYRDTVSQAQPEMLLILRHLARIIRHMKIRYEHQSFNRLTHLKRKCTLYRKAEHRSIFFSFKEHVRDNMPDYHPDGKGPAYLPRDRFPIVKHVMFLHFAIFCLQFSCLSVLCII